MLTWPRLFFIPGMIACPAVEPMQQLLRIALVSLLSDDILDGCWLVLVDPHETSTALAPASQVLTRQWYRHLAAAHTFLAALNTTNKTKSSQASFY